MRVDTRRCVRRQEGSAHLHYATPLAILPLRDTRPGASVSEPPLHKVPLNFSINSSSRIPLILNPEKYFWYIREEISSARKRFPIIYLGQWVNVSPVMEDWIWNTSRFSHWHVNLSFSRRYLIVVGSSEDERLSIPYTPNTFFLHSYIRCDRVLDCTLFN